MTLKGPKNEDPKVMTVDKLIYIIGQKEIEIIALKEMLREKEK